MAATLLPAGVTGAELSRLEDCWLSLLSPLPWGEAQAAALIARGEILFGMAARLLGRDPAEAKALGAAWSLADAARHCRDPESDAFLRGRAEAMVAELSRKRLPSELLPLTMIVVRRAYDLLHGDRRGWHRMYAALRFVLFGKMPR